MMMDDDDVVVVKWLAAWTDQLRCGVVKTIVDGGIAVMGHVGLRPQHISVLGGFRAQGRTGCAAQD